MNFVYADSSRNLLHMIFVGTLDRAEARQVLETAREALALLRPGLDVLTDLRDLKVVNEDAVEFIAGLMELSNARGVGRVVRVLPAESENFGFAILSCFHYGPDVHCESYLTLEAASARLLAAKKGNAAIPDGVPKPPA